MLLKVVTGGFDLAKSYRAVNIRVTSENETNQDGVVIYTLLDIEKILNEWVASAGITYWLIEHEADDEVSKTHFHIVIKFKSPTPFETIKNKFPYGLIEKTGSLKASIQYLIHLNDKSKKQFSWGDVKTSCLDMTPYKVLSNSQQEVTLHRVLELIDLGKIRAYNQFTEIPIELWAKHKTRIENALTYAVERICMDKNRQIEVIFISGATGLGKTTFAKDFSQRMNKSYCVSSASNDPLQDYKGEDVLILDDLKESDFDFTDLLKLLDNHTKSTGRSRYHNKSFIGDVILITSVKPVNNWYFDLLPDVRRQLYRRVRQWFKFTPEKIEAFEYDDNLCKYLPAGSVPNYIAMKARERAKLACKVFDAMGLEFTPADRKQIDDAIKSYSDADWEKFDKEIPEATEEERKANEAYQSSLPSVDWDKVNKYRVG